MFKIIVLAVILGISNAFVSPMVSLTRIQVYTPTLTMSAPETTFAQNSEVSASLSAPPNTFMQSSEMSASDKVPVSNDDIVPEVKIDNLFPDRKISKKPDNKFIPDMGRRKLMNLLLAGTVGLNVAAFGLPYVYFFVPPKQGGGSSSTNALDALGSEIKADQWLETHQTGDRSLVQGLKGDATYLIVTEENAIESYGLNAVCTHLGCVVPWNKAANKFICPCHGSQYDSTGKVVRGPAPLSLALAHVENDDGKIVFETWTEKDFRTGLDPWWK
jgi:cytochrome b6-f complex iron-sulfur subunit